MRKGIADIPRRVELSRAANARYLDALSVVADPTPRLALSAVARRRGDRGTALRELQRVFDLPATEPERHDPLWTYHVAQARNADDLLEQMRRPFRAAVER